MSVAKEHPFAQFVRIIGRGPNLSRPLDEEEMFEAASMIMKGEVEPLQLGAFLCILRVRTEVPGEGAGFVRAAREFIKLPKDAPKVDVDWASYSGKKRQLPWFLLSAIMLSQNGIKICMQGTEGHTEGRLFSRTALEHLGVPIAGSLVEASEQIKTSNFTYLPLANFVPQLQEIIELKPILGVRSPVNTFARMLNPFNAPNEMQTVFHPNYQDVHRDTAELLGQKNMAVFKGEGGEAERRPHKPVVVQMLLDGKRTEEQWPPMLEDHDYEKDEDMDLSHLGAVWNGTLDNDYATGAIIGTAAIVLRLMGRANDPDSAIKMASEMWESRNRDKLFPAG
ncbi:MAG: glycosyl transferase family protein [Rhodospirillaceae bacterium]|nr:glycosyl transferase family protein [Rhodospirillaceae bacterium]